MRAIEGVAALGADGDGDRARARRLMRSTSTRPATAGCGCSTAGGAKRLRVSYRAGMAADPNGVPEALRHGIVRLAAHIICDAAGPGDAGPPAAVTALWRPWRRLRLR